MKLLGTNQPLSAPADWLKPPTARDPDVARALHNLKAMPITKGKGVADHATLGDSWMEWEDKLTRHLFGKKREDGRRQYTTVYVEEPKKTGKSHYCAGLGLYALGGLGEFGAEVYSAGYNQKQAKVTWGIALDMIRLSPALKKRFDDRKEYRNQILCPATHGIWEPLTKQELGQHGFNPFVVLFDELHTQQSRDMWDTIKHSMGAREEPLLFAITNAGYDRTSICWEVRDYALRVNRGEIEDPSFLGVVFGADEEDDDWTEEAVWKRANPALGVTVPVDFVRKECEEAMAQPSAQNPFKRWHLSMWTQQDTRWLSPDDWERCAEEYTEQELAGLNCYAGLDLGSVEDLCAWVKVFPDAEDNERVRVVCDAWCAEARLTDRANIYHSHYQAWARAGHLRVCPGDVVDYGMVRKKILEDAGEFGLLEMAIDSAFQGHQLMVELGRDHGLTVVQMNTTYAHMTAPCDELERRIRMDPPKIVHDGNPLLAWAVGNVALRQPDPDRKRPVKDAKDAKIDPVVALLMGLDRSMRNEGRGKSRYEEEGATMEFV
jgi:phage terminase large subunit-like protein